MKLSRTVAYALQATLQLAGHDSDTPVPCSQLAAEGKMPERFLLQILRNLVAHGVLDSTRGVDGGYTLSRPAAETSLLEVIEAIDGPMISTVPVGGGLPDDSKTRLQETLEAVTEATRRELGAIKLADLVAGPSCSRPTG
jgi:Rrf2 family protein